MARTVNVATMGRTSDQGGEAKSRREPDYIADNLRKLFGAIESEPLPPRLRDLLAQLAADTGPSDGHR